jgi:hypothetical protein
VPVLGEGGGGHVGDVLDIDERLGHRARRKRDDAVAYAVGEKVLTEVLREEARPHDRPFGPVVPWGNSPDGSTTMVIGTYQMRGEVSQRLLALSAAFKRVHGVSPAQYRLGATVE